MNFSVLEQVRAYFDGRSWPEPWPEVASLASTVGLMLFVAWLSDFLARRVLLAVVGRIVARTHTDKDDALFKHNVFKRLAHVAPALVVYLLAPVALEGYEVVVEAVRVAAQVWMVLVVVGSLSGLLNAFADIYSSYDVSRRLPIRPVVQVGKIVIFGMAVIYAFSLLLGKSPIAFFSGLGAMSAVLLLIFRDAILGLVAGIQLTANNLVEVGDWIQMDKYGVDGDVKEINLTTVVVQNWDKTLSVIPAYDLVSDSFKNWRGMQESGGRRIKRSLTLDYSTVKFCDEEMLERFQKFEYIRDYVKDKIAEVKAHNEEKKVDTTYLINGRHLTNLGTFRAYVKAYLENHPQISRDLTFLVRQLDPTPQGIPIQVYVFSKDQVWANYEAIQADIFDHLIAVVPLFDLRIYQQPSGADVRAMFEGIELEEIEPETSAKE